MIGAWAWSDQAKKFTGGWMEGRVHPPRYLVDERRHALSEYEDCEIDERAEPRIILEFRDDPKMLRDAI